VWLTNRTEGQGWSAKSIGVKDGIRTDFQDKQSEKIPDHFFSPLAMM
jgi:hypothetical protein